MTASLENLHVLVIDCQTTGSAPARGRVLELGWLAMRAADSDSALLSATKTMLLTQPEGGSLPARVSKLTGIASRDLDQACLPDEAWKALAADARKVASQNQLHICPAVIHFARFELAFLRSLHQQRWGVEPFPFEAICTHEIATLLWPVLPRKGLRALAGFLGHSVPVLKRCEHHLLATAVIWRQQVELLKTEWNLNSLAALRRWLADAKTASPAKSSKRIFPMPGAKRKGLPQRPGVYRFLRSNGDLLYIGKAGNLRQRINSYFHPSRRHSENTLEMLTQAADLDIRVTDSAVEAALLESGEIKRHNPPYNIALMSNSRPLVYFSRDFKHRASKADDRCRLGPLPSKDVIRAVHEIGTVLVHDETALLNINAPRMLAQAERYCPDDGCLREGVALFRQKHALTGGQTVWRTLIEVGRRAWLDKAERTSESTGEGEGDATAFEWTPEAVLRRMEGLLRHVGHLLRRARWLTVLCESTVAWAAEDRNGGHLKVLVFAHGEIVERTVTDTAAELPVPPGYGRAFHDRQANLDLATYDRLRVLTTEFRRLAALHRSIHIRLSPSAILHSDQVQRLLAWV